MIPNAADVVRARWITAIALRVLSIPVSLVATLPLGSWIIEGIADADLFWLSYYAPRIISGVAILGLGAAMFLLAGVFARLVIRLPRATRCPRCGHDVSAPVEPRCSECGLPLTPEFSATAPTNSGPETTAPSPTTPPAREHTPPARPARPPASRPAPGPPS